MLSEFGVGCFSNELVDIYDDCKAAGWGKGSASGFFPQFGELACNIPSALYEDDGDGKDRFIGEACNIHGAESAYPSCTLLYGDPPQFLKKTDFPDLGNGVFVANCSRGGTIPGAIPPGINMNGETECTCDSASGYVGDWPNCACPIGATANENGVCVCPNNHTLFGGVCIPDSPRDFGELSDAVLCEAFGGEVFKDTLPPEAEQLKRSVAGEARTTSPTPSPAAVSVFVAMTNAIEAKFRGDIVAVNAFLSRYDTGGADYNAYAYIRIVFRANRAYGAGTFLDGNSNELARILARVLVKGPDKCGANNSAALCILDDEADSAGVLPCRGQFPPLWACRNAGWSFSINNGGSCGVLLTLAGGTTSDQCNLSGSASPQCDDVFGADVDFPAPTLSTDGATLRFVYNCDPNGNKKLIPATTNTIAATECTCTTGEEMYGGACVPVCAETEIRAGGVCVASAFLDKCEGAGWDFSPSENSCGVLLTLAGGAASDKCYLSGSTSPQCADVFASTVHYFPSPTLAADGATLRFVYNCDPDGESGLIPATANTIAATECGCESGASVFSDVCIPDEGDDFGLSDELLCGAFGGTVRTATGGREVCSGMDANDTFCIMDSAVGFPCRGLFKHLRSCNLEFNRKALNPFFCGEKCGAQKAVGSECI